MCPGGKNKEIERLRRSINRQASYGRGRWVQKLCIALGLELTIRERGRPRKVEKSSLSSFPSTIFCGQHLLDTQDRSSYISPVKKQFLIKAQTQYGNGCFLWTLRIHSKTRFLCVGNHDN